jgi:hypothetical protein
MVRRTAQISPTSTSIPAAAAISFMRETRGLVSWTVKNLQKSLLIPVAQARDVIQALELQGYVKQVENSQEWLTTLNGEAVSGSKLPRFDRQGVEKTLSSLAERIKFVNKDPRSPYKVAQAVAFGDFLSNRFLAQAADVEIQLVARDAASESDTRKSKREFLKKVRARDLKVNLMIYEPWMSQWSHRDLPKMKRGIP